jgi:hypothetical protein
MKPRLVDAAGLALGYKPEKPRIKRLNGGAERDRTRCESIPTVDLSIRPLSPSNHKVEELQYSSCFQLEPASNRFKIPFP